MKPSKRFMCPDCGKPKMLFETERKAKDFIRWNGGDIPHGEDLRAYFCPSCCGWHISHQKHRASYDKSTERLIGAYERSRQTMSKIDKLIHFDEYQHELRNIEEEAKHIYSDIPTEIKREGKKGKIRRFLDEYFKDKAIKDKGGSLRGAVYKVFEKDTTRLIGQAI